jgi:hypothetical protein
VDNCYFCSVLHNTVLPFYVEAFLQTLTKLLKKPLNPLQFGTVTSIKLTLTNLADLVFPCKNNILYTKLCQLPQSLYALELLTPRNVNRLQRSQQFEAFTSPLLSMSMSMSSFLHTYQKILVMSSFLNHCSVCSGLHMQK